MSGLPATFDSMKLTKHLTKMNTRDKDTSQNEHVQKTIRMPEGLGGDITDISGHETIIQGRKVSENEAVCALLSMGRDEWAKKNPGKLKKK
jgi:hypothetical protein